MGWGFRELLGLPRWTSPKEGFSQSWLAGVVSVVRSPTASAKRVIDAFVLRVSGHAPSAHIGSKGCEDALET